MVHERLCGIAVLALLGLWGCAETAPIGTSTAAVATPAPAAADEDRMALHVFDCGRIRLPTVTDFGLEDTQTKVRELFVPCYLIRHPDGDLLWDAGLPPAYAEADGWVADAGAEHRLVAPISAQLRTVELAPGDIEFVAFSHFHYDHVGDANAFAGAEMLVQRAEYEVAFGDSPGVAFFLPELYSALADGPRRLLDGEFDVFGDGRVRIIPAPGHTPGHQVLLVDLPETGKVLLSGDLWHFFASRELGAVPNFNTDGAQTLASMQKIEALIVREGAELWLQHSLAFHEELDLAPYAYR
ncbi:MAG: N-acyl homoserine lactonase family protein [Pseudomonadales bacterium]|nr:N-acyl homoserine lactonase family protein [Pseudomonadales bacterium]